MFDGLAVTHPEENRMHTTSLTAQQLHTLRALHEFGAALTAAYEAGQPIDPAEAGDRFGELYATALAVGIPPQDAAAAYASGVDWEPFGA